MYVHVCVCVYTHMHTYTYYIYIYIYVHLKSKVWTELNSVISFKEKPNKIKGIRSRRWNRRTWSSPPPWTHQKYIYIWRDSCWKLTADWQKNFYTSRTVRNIHTECDMKRRETWYQDLCPWEGLWNRRRITQVEILPGEWSVWTIHWTLQP